MVEGLRVDDEGLSNIVPAKRARDQLSPFRATPTDAKVSTRQEQHASLVCLCRRTARTEFMSRKTNGFGTGERIVRNREIIGVHRDRDMCMSHRSSRELSVCSGFSSVGSKN